MPDNESFAALADPAPLSDASLDEFAGRLESLPLDDALWVAELYRECRRARAAEQRLSSGDGNLQGLEADIAQVVLDAAEWLKTLWTVGYMGAARFPATPCSAFPSVEVEDVLKSALLSRIRQGKRPLPFPPPTRHGVPWHEVVEQETSFSVDTAIVRDEHGMALAANIEGCNDWNIVSGHGDLTPDCEFVVQHAGKGPLYRLAIDGQGASTLTRLPPTRRVRIATRERAGGTVFLLEWPRPDGKTQSVPLRAATLERADSEASYWIASHHAELYGQVEFEHTE